MITLSPILNKGYILLVILTFCNQHFNAISAQNISEALISFEVDNENLRSALKRLAGDYDINLTYNASDEVFDTKISLTAHNKKIITILSDMLAQVNHTFQEVGNHLVILQMPESIVKPNITAKPQPENKKSSHPKIQTDTVIMHVDVPVIFHDTVFLYDTIVKIEHQIIYDTVFIEKGAQQSGRARAVSLSNNILRFEPNRSKGFALAFSYSQLAAGYDVISPDNLTPQLREVKDSETFSFRSFGLGASIQYNTGRLSIAGGLSLSNFSNRFYYSEIFTSGGFTKTDTLDVFFTIIQNDTVWKYVTDTTWVPLNREELLYDRLNRIGLLEMNLSAVFAFYNNNNFSLYTMAGLHTGLPVWLRGNNITNEAGFPAIKLEKEIFTELTFGYKAGLGAKIQLSDWTDIYAETFYKRYISETSLNHPLERRLHGFGLLIGLLYYL